MLAEQRAVIADEQHRLNFQRNLAAFGDADPHRLRHRELRAQRLNPTRHMDRAGPLNQRCCDRPVIQFQQGPGTKTGKATSRAPFRLASRIRLQALSTVAPRREYWRSLNCRSSERELSGPCRRSKSNIIG
jgi:hypothetical protein